MKTIVGFCFTEQPIKHLTEIGFVFQRNDELTLKGYREFICLLPENRGTGHSLEIREILNEEIYFQFQTQKNFNPFENENSALCTLVSQPHLIQNVQGLLDANMEEGDLKNYLSIRKIHPLWAVWLKCADFSILQKSVTTEKLISWRGQPAMVISMGESCYDLVVT